ncbi:MAG: serine/threonine-protein phosphatase, partial [Leucobacter sp.]
AVMTAGGRPDAVCDELLRMALEAGGRDNITLIVADVLAGGAQLVIPEVVDDDDDTIEQTRPRWR